MRGRKGALSLFGLENVILSLVVIGVLIGAGLYAMLSFSAQMPANSAAQNATNDTAEILGDMPTTWFPILIVMIFVGIIIMLLRGWLRGDL